MAEYRVSIQFGSGIHFFQGTKPDTSLWRTAHWVEYLRKRYQVSWLKRAKAGERRCPRPIIRVWKMVQEFEPKEKNNG